MKDYLKKHNYNIYFIVAFITIFLISIIRYPSLSFRAEIWAELGTNYLITAIEKTFYENMFTVDAGYLVWLPRLIAWITYKIFPVFYFPYITNIFGLGFIAFSLSFLNFRDFRSIIKSDEIRFFLSLLLGLFIVPNYENFTFTNFSYQGIFFCFLVIFLNFKNMGNFSLIVFSLLTALFCISKFHFVLFLPIYLIIIVWTLKNRNYKGTCFFLPSIITMGIQITNIIKIIKTDTFIQNNTVAQKSLIVTIEHILRGTLWYIQAYIPKVYPILALAFLSIMIVIFYRLFKARYISRPGCLFVIIGNYVAVAFISISCLSELGNIEFYYTKGNKILFNRWDFVTYDLIFLMVFFLLYQLHKYLDDIKSNKKTLVKRLLILYLIISLGMTFHKSGEAYNSTNSNSSWREFYILLEYPDYFLPINPSINLSLAKWSLRKECDDLANIDNVNGDTIDTSLLYFNNKYIRAIYLKYPKNEELKVVAYDKNNNIISEGKMLSQKGRERKYILFSDKVSPYYIKIMSKGGQNVILDQNNPVLIVGK
ncbi:MAG: hypothetical protein H6Q69_715 [Firmicutes bacterium]|nr:hypothetical protein [Bacillota bacterium]